ncbi:MAG: oxygenase, partial [Gemmatimonadetes bacterium]|nr:oxygenase [Gemmatimonadota bacterium]
AALAALALRRTRRPVLGATAVTAALGLGVLAAFPSSRAEVLSLASCAALASEGFRPVATGATDRFTGKVQDITARCRGGRNAVAHRDAPWVDWSNYWGAGDSASLGPGSPLRLLSPARRGVDGALLDLEYQRIELIRNNLYDNGGTFDDYVRGRDGTPGRALDRWPELRLPPSHPAFARVGGEGEQVCGGELIRWRTLTGICNDLFNPAMGSSGMLFARNVPFEETFPERGLTELTRNRHQGRIDLLTPDPQRVSRTLFTREQSDAESCGGGFGSAEGASVSGARVGSSAGGAGSDAGATSAESAVAGGGADPVRCDYQPAPFFNVLAAFWIQFMTHDWFSHLAEGRNADASLPLGCTDPSMGCDPAARMEAARIAEDGAPPTFDAGTGTRWNRAPAVTRNAVTAWWDGSQIYGWDSVSVRRVKRDPADPARLWLPAGTDPQGLLPLLGAADPQVPEWRGQEATAFPDNWSIGLSFLHNVFAREHNQFVDAFRARTASHPDADSGLRDPARPDSVLRYRDVGDEALFQVARLVVSAEIAKIHTIEWTTQLLYNEPLYRAMNANWSGLFQSDLLARATERVVRRLVRSDDEVDTTQWYSVFASGSGIFGLGSRRFDLTENRDVWSVADPEDVNGGVNHFGSPFNFPEEFVTVYRLHPLVPDVLELRTLSAPDRIGERLPVVRAFRQEATAVRDRVGLGDLGLSMGRQRLGLLTLKNHPAFLQNLPMPIERTGTGRLDVAALDLIRDRERGIPRFNEFRRQYGLQSVTSFDDFVDGRLPLDSSTRAFQMRLVEDLRAVYGQHTCDDTLPITAAEERDGRPLTDCLGHPDGTVVDNVEDLDMVVGFLAESARPHGFAISETQFVVFILNASRRLFSDRFFTSSFRPEFYTHLGVEWVEHNGPDGPQWEPELVNGHPQEVSPFKRVLLRTVPTLAPELDGVVNAFDPWARDRGGYYSLAWRPRPGREADEAFRR